MLLTIVTRTFNARPMGLAANITSVRKQAESGEIQHLIVEDEVGRGVAWAQENLRNEVAFVKGDYVLLLDDDDFLVDANLVYGLRRQVLDAPEIIICKMNMGDGRILPDADHWGERPERGHIPCSSYIVRRDVWNEHVADFAPKYDGDFDFIDAVWKHGHPFQWWNNVVARVGQVSHGKAEDGATVAVRV